MEPVVDGLEQKYAGRYDVRIMNTSSDPEAQSLYAKYDLPGVPAFVFLNADGSQSGTVIGAVAAEALDAEFAKLK